MIFESIRLKKYTHTQTENNFLGQSISFRPFVPHQLYQNNFWKSLKASQITGKYKRLHIFYKVSFLIWLLSRYFLIFNSFGQKVHKVWTVYVVLPSDVVHYFKTYLSRLITDLNVCVHVTITISGKLVWL